MPEEMEQDLNSEEDTEVAEIEDVESLKQALQEEKAKSDGNLANWQRTQADFINYKRRSQQEREEISQFVNATLMLGLLPMLDDIERAFTSIPSELAEHPWVDGIRLIDRKLRTSLEAMGLSPIKAMGEPFDPNLHEAVMQSKGEEGIVVQELEKGYKLHDKVIRPSKVAVGNGEE